MKFNGGLVTPMAMGSSAPDHIGLEKKLHGMERHRLQEKRIWCHCHPPRLCNKKKKPGAHKSHSRLFRILVSMELMRHGHWRPFLLAAVVPDS